MGIDIVEAQEIVEAPLKKNVQLKKNIKPKSGKVGDIAEYHARENEYESWDEACLFVEIHVPMLIKINGEPFQGKKIVPQCTADYINWMVLERQRNEEQIFRSKKLERTVAHLS